MQAEAVAVIEARTAGIRDGIVLETRQLVERAYVALTTELAEHFAALAPVNARLLELRRAHGGRPTGADLDSAVWWDELGMGENPEPDPIQDGGVAGPRARPRHREVTDMSPSDRLQARTSASAEAPPRCPTCHRVILPLSGQAIRTTHPLREGECVVCRFVPCDVCGGTAIASGLPANARGAKMPADPTT